MLFSGFNDKQSEFIDTIFEKMIEFQITDEVRFESIRFQVFVCYFWMADEIVVRTVYS